jgi:Pyruvate/2-oxoacid:ferredoxin oxidoreductase gamma subunit/Pyruvate/2-oxoacid:ferredoxin oxidoreductase delta subunit
MEREILFTGIGGQGIQLAAQVLARAALAEGREVMLFGSYGGTMRGGPTDATLVVADAPVSAPPIVSRAWSAIAMHPGYFPLVAAKLVPGAVVLVNAPLFREPVAGDRWQVHALDASAIASQGGSSLAGALVLVGAHASVTGLVGLDALVAALAASLPERRQQHRETNERALRAGFAALPRDSAPAWPRAEAQHEYRRLARHGHARASRCKGCELCIPACPPRVLRMSKTRNANGYAIPELFPGCTGCGACLLVCPDFCFEIYQYEKPVVHEVSP